jgi:hypothetical protein
MNATNKPLPTLHSDEGAEAFVANDDLTSYDLSGFKPMNFEVERAALENPDLPVKFVAASLAALAEPRDEATPFVPRSRKRSGGSD